MYIEDKSGGLDGPARIGLVEISRTGRSYSYDGKQYHRVAGYKYNCVEEGAGRYFWIAGPKKRGGDKLYGGVVAIDDNVRVEYWTQIRGKPGCVALKQTK